MGDPDKGDEVKHPKSWKPLTAIAARPTRAEKRSTLQRLASDMQRQVIATPPQSWLTPGWVRRSTERRYVHVEVEETK